MGRVAAAMALLLKGLSANCSSNVEEDVGTVPRPWLQDMIVLLWLEVAAVASVVPSKSDFHTISKGSRAYRHNGGSVAGPGGLGVLRQGS